MGPLLLTFSISMFVLVMTFLWRKIETLIGKGLEWTTLLELFAYASATMVPMALPLSILLASIMTMGNFGEKYELVAMKSAGLSLWRIFRPLIILAVVFSCVAFYFSGWVIPAADLRTKQLAADIKDKKPAINIRPNEFYTQISSYVIRIDKKDKRTNKMYGVLIYNHSKDMGNVEMIKADSGYMYSAENNQTMIFKLYDGEVFSEDVGGDNYIKRPLTRIKFKQQILRFDVSDFAMQQSDKDKYSDSYKVLGVTKLYTRVDSLQDAFAKNQAYYSEFIMKRYHADTLIKNTSTIKSDFYKDYSLLDSTKQKITDNYARDLLSGMFNEYSSNMEIRAFDEAYITRHWIEFYRKFTLSIACVILFFIGAPLGSIIRKGGLGMPVVVSIIAFAIYYVIGMIGESAAKTGSLSPLVAMWLSSIIFLPVGIFLTIKAMTDSKVLSAENWQRLFAKFFALFRIKKNKAAKIIANPSTTDTKPKDE